MHRPGIEPGPPAWQASILPLNQRCFDDGEVDEKVFKETKLRLPFSSMEVKVSEYLRLVKVG